MNKAWQWLQRHSVSSKTIATAWLFVVGLYYASSPFHDYVTWMYTKVPTPLHAFIAGVVIPACMFWKTWKAGQGSVPPPPPPKESLAQSTSILKLTDDPPEAEGHP